MMLLFPLRFKLGLFYFFKSILITKDEITRMVHTNETCLDQQEVQQCPVAAIRRLSKGDPFNSLLSAPLGGATASAPN